MMGLIYSALSKYNLLCKLVQRRTSVPCKSGRNFSDVVTLAAMHLYTKGSRTKLHRLLLVGQNSSSNNSDNF